LLPLVSNGSSLENILLTSRQLLDDFEDVYFMLESEPDYIDAPKPSLTKLILALINGQTDPKLQIDLLGLFKGLRRFISLQQFGAEIFPHLLAVYDTLTADGKLEFFTITSIFLFTECTARERKLRFYAGHCLCQKLFMETDPSVIAHGTLLLVRIYREYSCEGEENCSSTVSLKGIFIFIFIDSTSKNGRGL